MRIANHLFYLQPVETMSMGKYDYFAVAKEMLEVKYAPPKPT